MGSSANLKLIQRHVRMAGGAARVLQHRGFTHLPRSGEKNDRKTSGKPKDGGLNMAGDVHVTIIRYEFRLVNRREGVRHIDTVTRDYSVSYP